MQATKPSPTISKINEMVISLIKNNPNLDLELNIDLDSLKLKNFIVKFCEFNGLEYRMYRKGAQVRRRATDVIGPVKIVYTEKIQ